MTKKKLLESIRRKFHQNGEIIITEGPDGIKKIIWLDGKLYEPDNLHDYIIEKFNEENKKKKELASALKELIDNSTVFYSIIELKCGFDGNVWENKVMKLLEEL